MKFEEALMHLRAGRKIKRGSWHNKNYYLKNYDCHECERDFKAEVLADDWELFEEPEKYYQDGIELPTIHNESTIEKRLSDLEFRLKEAERFQDITHEQYMSIARKEKPHACQSCDGNGAIPMHHEPKAILDRMQAKRDERGMHYRDCNTCKGKGVLWR